VSALPTELAMITTPAPDADAPLVAVGELDVATCPALRKLLTERIQAGDVDLVIDMARVTFIDAGPIGALLAARQAVEARGGSVTLLHPSEAVRNTIAVLGIDHLLRMEPAEEVRGDGL
jgi:anti-sigma B factor antagonist